MGRALSYSLVAHALFAFSFLLLSATRTTLVIPQIARPVRLVAYLEPSAAPPRAARPAAVPAPAIASAPAPRVAPLPAAAAPPPLVVPRVEIPLPGRTEPVPRKELPAPPEAALDLSQRLARRLASATPPPGQPAEVSAPQIASLPRPEPVSAPPVPEVAPAGTRAVSGAIAPVGFFPHAWYLSVLKERVFARWSPPSEFFAGRRPPAAQVFFRISRDGRIGSIALRESSGSSRFDNSAMAAVQGLGQVPPLPEQYTEENLDVIIRFQNEQ